MAEPTSDPTPRRWLDPAAVMLTRVLAAVFYRNVEMSGVERVPASGPLLFTANHGNSLVDPLLLIARLPRRIRFLAKSTLWQNPVLVPLLALAGAVPLQRRQDGGDMSKNQDTFFRCHRELAAGGAIALFPEGTSYHAAALQPLKTGAARIALGADPALRIVPVGLTFEDKGRFRSRALLLVGEPLDPAPERALAKSDERLAVHALTARIEEALRAVTLNFESFEVARLLERAAEVYAQGERLLPGRGDLIEHLPLRQALGERYAEARAAHPEHVQRIEQMAQRYDGMLDALRLRDDQVSARYPWSHVGAYISDRVTMLLLALPIAAVGTLLNYLPYRLPGLVARRVRQHGDLPATYKILTGMIALPACWALEAWAAASVWGPAAGAAVAVAAPVTGWFALLFHERHGSLWREVRAYLTLRLRPARTQGLRDLRADIRRELEALARETHAS